MIRRDGGDPAPSSRLCIALGHLAQERGTDAAGLATATREPVTKVTAVDTASPDVTQAGWRTVKQPGPFASLAQPTLEDSLNAARAVLGHTRWATQGDRSRLANTSPLSVGQIIGTHNGDVDPDLLRDRYTLAAPGGQTDTEVVFQALDQAGADVAATLEVLESIVGRAALVWTDRRRPDHLWMARTAISPLALAVDDDGTLYWASNPGWFHTAAEGTGIRISPQRIWLVPEGTLLLVDFSSGQPHLAERHPFTATARALDEGLADRVAYLGFSTLHRWADQRLLRHRTHEDEHLPVRAGDSGRSVA